MSTALLVLCAIAGLLSAEPLSAAGPITDSVVHDVGVSRIIEPGPLLAAGDTVIPWAEIVNYGTETERYFDVRFRIGTVYDTSVTVTSIGPGSVLPVFFSPWVATPGSHAVTCSTRLATDANPDNDRVSLSVVVFRSMHLDVRPGQSGTIHPTDSADFLLSAVLQGDSAAFVALETPGVSPGWNSAFFDSAGRHEITDLGRLRPGQTRFFLVRVKSPSDFPLWPSPPAPETIAVRAFCAADSSIAGTALLLITPAPGDFEIHNFPNPLVERTTFQLSLPHEGNVKLHLYNRASERVATIVEGRRPAGFHFIAWRPENDRGQLLAPGTYQYLLEYSAQGRTRHVRKKLVITTEQR